MWFDWGEKGEGVRDAYSAFARRCGGGQLGQSRSGEEGEVG